MTRVTFQNGRVVFNAGKVGTESECCCGGKCCFLCGCTATVTIKMTQQAGGDVYTGQIVLSDCSLQRAMGTGMDEAGGVAIDQVWLGKSPFYDSGFTDLSRVTCPIAVVVSGQTLAWTNYNVKCKSCCEPVYEPAQFGGFNLPTEYPTGGQYLNRVPIGSIGQDCTLELLSFELNQFQADFFESVTIDSITCDPCENPLP